MADDVLAQIPKRHMTREQRAREEAEWKRINEEIALESEGIEPLLIAMGICK